MKPDDQINTVGCDTCSNGRTARQTRIRLATYEGCLTKTPDLLVRIYSLLNPGIHTEIWIDNFRISAVDGEGGANCIKILETDAGILDAHVGWHVVDLPITDPGIAVDYIQRVHCLPIRYGISVPECALPKFCLDEIDQDIDCCRPETWKQVFCSQFALLFLRHCAISGILQVPKDKARLLWSVNSKGCLPSRLQIITDRIFSS